MEPIHISAQGFEKMKNELEKLKAERPEIIQAIKEAREEGDLRENAGYDAARERQGMQEARINYIESRLPRYNVIDLDSLDSETVIFGATVELEDIDTGDTKTYTILGPDDSDYSRNGSISYLSPVARMLIGKEVGDEITVEVPRGLIQYEIISINFRGSKIFKS